MAPEFNEGGIVGQTSFTNEYRFFNSLLIGRRVKMLLKSMKLWSSESAKTFRLRFAVLPQKNAVSTKFVQRQILRLFSLCVDRINAVQLLNLVLFQNLHSLMTVAELSGDRANFLFLMAVTCSPPCIVTALALCRVCVECLLTKNGTSLKFSGVGIGFVVFQQKLWYASSSLPPNVTLVSSVTMRSPSNLPVVVVKHLIWNVKPIQILFLSHAIVLGIEKNKV